MERIKTEVRKGHIQIKNAALIEYLRHGLLLLLHAVSLSLQELIKKEGGNLLHGYCLRAKSLCSECEVDPKDGFVHIGCVSRCEVLNKIKREEQFCRNELLVLVIDILHKAHSHLRSQGVADFIAILYSNVKLDLIFKNHCEVLKAFSATGPYKNIEFIEDLPMHSVISVIINCSLCTKYLNINLRDRHNLIIKVSLLLLNKTIN